MAMQINGNYDHSRTDYAEKVKEKQAAEKAKEAENAAKRKNSGKLSEPQDEYISSEKSERKPTGLYRIGQDENGNRKIFSSSRYSRRWYSSLLRCRLMIIWSNQSGKYSLRKQWSVFTFPCKMPAKTVCLCRRDMRAALFGRMRLFSVRS